MKSDDDFLTSGENRFDFASDFCGRLILNLTLNLIYKQNKIFDSPVTV